MNAPRASTNGQTKIPSSFSADLAVVARGEHHDPHTVLGHHISDGRSYVNAYRPGAKAMRVLVPGAKPVEMECLQDGVFVGQATPAWDNPEPYLLQTEYPDGTVITIDDPYRFPPTVGELDI
ncbi:MAG TPA: 1,4-alpha-glucan branching enzyme, partial [Actinomycetota bacterium]|nr:1,4-alpha-glucan branching enzyme [Actinomycetota bacterium]